MNQNATPSLPSILLIDDDAHFLESMTTVLRSRGEITAIHTREQFQEQFASRDFRLVITDYRMNFWNGLDVISQIKTSRPATPVIVVSAHADKEMAIKCANLQIFRILEKPLELDEFHQAVDAALSNKPTSPSGSASLYGIYELYEPLFTIRFDGHAIQLTETEFNIFKILVQNINHRVERNDFQDRLWGNIKVAPNVLDTHLLNLKRKLPFLKEKLKNIRGKGYTLLPFHSS